MNKNPLLEMAEINERAAGWYADDDMPNVAANEWREARILRAAAAVISWIQENPERIPAALDDLVDDFEAACKEVPK